LPLTNFYGQNCETEEDPSYRWFGRLCENVWLTNRSWVFSFAIFCTLFAWLKLWVTMLTNSLNDFTGKRKTNTCYYYCCIFSPKLFIGWVQYPLRCSSPT
jgi:hypothetical protein